MSVVFLFPPVVDPRAPHLAIPSLAAYLRRNGVEVSVRDLNLEALEWIADEAYLQSAASAVEERLRNEQLCDEKRAFLRGIMARTPFIVVAAGRAISDLRSPDAFFDPDRHHQARNTLRYALALASAAKGRICYNISSAQYDIEGIDPSNLADLARATAAPELNLFHDLWTSTILADLERSRPDVVGVPILNGQQILPGLMLARMLKERGYIVALGGTVFSKFVAELRARPGFFSLFCDGLIAYEGERALLEMHEAVRDGRPLSRVVNLLSLDGARVVSGPVHVEDVNSLPTPDFNGLPLHRYLAPFPVLPLLTGKGCYFNRCKFCDIPSINAVSGKAYRRRRPDLIAADIGQLARHHAARHFVITDEALSPQLLVKLADALEQVPDAAACRPRFVGYARFERGFSEPVCRRLHEMGVRKLYFGLESGAQDTLDHMHKGIRLPTTIEVLRNCRAAGIAYHLFSMIGFPQEGESSARATMAYFVENRELFEDDRNSFDIHRFGLDLRTPYFEEAEQFGIEIDHDQLARSDFPLSVERWRNKSGLSAEDVDRLLGEFDPRLSDIFAGTRCYPENHWPAFEEYAVLYSDRYPQGFAYRMTLPAAGSDEVFRLVWSESVRIGEPADGAHLVWSVGGSIEIGTLAFEILPSLTNTPHTVDGLLDGFVARIPHDRSDEDALRAELRALFDELMKTRALWYRPQPRDPVPAPARRDRATRSRSVRLNRNTQIELIYHDNSRFGSVAGRKLCGNIRRLFGPLLQHAARDGLAAAVARGPELLRRSIETPAFREIVERIDNAGWVIRPDILHPDPALTFPVAVRVSSNETQTESLIPTSAREFPALVDLISELEAGVAVRGCSTRFAMMLNDLKGKGLVEAIDSTSEDSSLEACDLAFVGHNTVVVRAGTRRIIVDPFFLPGAACGAQYLPLRPHDLGPVDAILITHSHPDHFDLPSLMRFGRNALIIVPEVPRESLLSIDMRLRLNEVGFTNVVALRWGERYVIADAEIFVLPFHGEQPSSGHVLHPEVRNQGSVYVVRGPRLTAGFVADAGRDMLGSVSDVAKQWAREFGGIDLLFAGYRGWQTYPAQLAFSSVPQFLLFVPPEEWRIRQKLMNDPEDAIGLAEAWEASTLVPYGAGGAPWHWQRGLGPRLDGAAGVVEDPSFDPMPQRVDDAARRRLWVSGQGWLAARPRILHMHPGDGLLNARYRGRIVVKGGCAWPWARLDASRSDGQPPGAGSRPAVECSPWIR
jgi:anaerobic magnesium-protoporphyrin IX monomethyl ester cyclase